MIRTAAMFLVGFAALVATSSASMPTTGSLADRNAPTIFRPASAADTDSAEANLIAHRSHRKSGKAKHKKQHHKEHKSPKQNRAGKKQSPRTQR
jgi:hypothetical protein